VAGATGLTGATGASITGATGVTGAIGITGATGTFATGATLFYTNYGTGASGVSVPIRLNDTILFATNTPDTVKLSVATGVTGAVITIGATGSSGGNGPIFYSTQATSTTASPWGPATGTTLAAARRLAMWDDTSKNLTAQPALTEAKAINTGMVDTDGKIIWAQAGHTVISVNNGQRSNIGQLQGTVKNVIDIQAYVNTGNDYVPANSNDNSTGDNMITRISSTGLIYNQWNVKDPSNAGSVAVWAGKPINYLIYYTRNDTP
jgi:hypothetical protein